MIELRGVYDYEFKIDIDYKPPNPLEFAKEFANRIIFIFKTLGIEFESAEVYETNKGYHIYVYAYSSKQLTNEQIILVQLALGSDYKREVFNAIRVMSGAFPEGNRSWNVLFEYKMNKGKVISKEDATPIAERMTRLINRICVRKFLG